MTSSAPGTGPAGRGSRLQLQVYVNEHPSLLQKAITSQIPELADVQIDWRSPRAKSEPDAFHEMRDDEFLHALDLADRVDDLRRSWPVRGPQWDGLGILQFPDGRRGELLIEAKANVPELLGGAATACKAGDVSRERIHKVLERTAQAIGAHPPSNEAWLGPIYQPANRLAHLYFLREILNRPGSWLLHILFEGDTTFKPTTRAQWEQALAEVDTALGLPSRIPHAGHVFVQALPKPADWPA